MHLNTVHPKEYSCGDCEVFTWIKERMLLHRATYHADRAAKLPCPYCEKACKSEVAYTNHLYRKHRDMVGGEGGTVLDKVSVLCDVCGKIIPKTLRNAHAMTHVERKFKCEQCGAAFKLRHHLSNHEKIHAEHEFECKPCKAKFRLKHHLEAHQRSFHDNLALFACNACDEVFRLRWKRTNHRKEVHGATGDSTDDEDDPGRDKRQHGGRTKMKKTS